MKPKILQSIIIAINEQKLIIDSLIWEVASVNAQLQDVQKALNAIDEWTKISMIDTQGTIIYVNKRFCEFYKYNRDEIVGKSYGVINPEFDPGNFSLTIEEMIHEGKIQERELKNKTKDGIDCWVQAMTVPIQDDVGNIIQYIQIATDITNQKKIELEHIRTLKLLDDLKNALDIASIVAITDAKGVITYANDTFCTMSGYVKEELIGNTHRIVNSGFHPKRFFKEMWQTITSGQIWKGEVQNRAKDGSTYWVSTTIVPFVDAQGVPYEYVAIRTDVTRLKQAEKSLETALKNDFQTTIKNLQNCIFKYRQNAEGKLVFTLSEGKAAEKIGFVTEAIYNKEVKDFFPEDVVHIMEQNFMGACRGTPMEFEMHLLDIDFLVYLSPIIQDHQVIEVVGTAIDITERKKSEQLINHMAYHDSLTGLPNRAFLDEQMETAIKENKTFAVLFIDLDRFKNINDTLGHRMGDLLLIAVSERLLDCMDEGHIVSRISGDEFVILLPNSDEEIAKRIAQRIIDRLSTSFIIGNNEMYITPSIGISMFPQDGDEPLKSADTAMYQAKNQGKNSFHFFTQDLDRKLKEKLVLENQLRKALEKEEFVLYYQPQIDITTGKMIGVEALVRWMHPEMGMVPPMEFIPLAEETGLIIPIGNWVLYQACQQNKAWQDAGYEPIPISVNVSLRQFMQKNFVQVVYNILRQTNLAPQYLELEITESMTMDIAYTERVLTSLRDLGIKVSMDDFGTGYSSLSYLRTLPINKLKIDQAFIRNLDKKNKAIVRTIISLALNLQIEVIAEGVELKEHVTFLKKYNCFQAQGYLFSKPVPKEELGKLMKNQ